MCNHGAVVSLSFNSISALRVKPTFAFQGHIFNLETKITLKLKLVEELSEPKLYEHSTSYFWCVDSQLQYKEDRFLCSFLIITKVIRKMLKTSETHKYIYCIHNN